MIFKKAGSLIMLSLILILSSCSFDNDLPKEEEIRKEKRKYTITVSDKTGEAGISAMDVLCSKAKELSDGDLTLVYTRSEDALQDFYDGADFIFAPNNEIARANGDFASYSSPFYFEDIQSALLTLNSAEFINHTSDITQSLLNGKQLGCFYNGTSVFVSNKIEDLLTFDEDGSILNTFDELRVYGDFGYIDEYLLSKLGIDTIEETSEEFTRRFNEAQCHTVMIKKHEMEKLSLSEKREHIYYYDQPYKIDYNWLFISDKILEDMPQRYVDILNEAVAYALGTNDEMLYKQEKRAEEHIFSYPLTFMEYSFEGAQTFSEEMYKSVRFKRVWDNNNHETVRNIL